MIFLIVYLLGAVLGLYMGYKLFTPGPSEAETTDVNRFKEVVSTKYTGRERRVALEPRRSGKDRRQ